MSQRHKARRPIKTYTKRRSHSRFRNEIVALHRKIYRHNQHRISEAVTGYTTDFKKYEKTYAQGVKRYTESATFEHLDEAIAQAHFVYFGDYHTLPQAQRSFVRMLKRLPQAKEVILALEFVQGRFQNFLDAYMQDQITDEVFLKKTQHHHFTGQWQSFKEIFTWAKEHHVKIIGIDSKGSLQKRDIYAAKKIAHTKLKHPEKLIMVFAGELHIAPQHLPKAVQHQLPKKLPHVIVYQNCEAIYHQLEQQGLEHSVALVKITPDRFCMLNTPPIVCQQSFLNHLDAEGEQIEAPEQNVKNYAHIVAKFFNLPIDNALEELLVTSVIDLSFLKILNKRGKFTQRELKQIRQQILSSESYCIPRAKIIYLANLSVNHAAEEATHYLRYVCSQTLSQTRYLIDAFYARCLEEAIGFLGSKLINHKRKTTDKKTLERIAKYDPIKKQRLIAKLTLRHLQFEKGGKKNLKLTDLYHSTPDIFNAITHLLGYHLGEKLFYGLIFGDIGKEEIRALFFENFEEENKASRLYLYWATRSKNVEIPERL